MSLKVIHSPPSHLEFNSIPHVSLTHNIYYETSDIRGKIDDLLHKYGLNNQCKPCSFHRHFEIQEDDVFIIEQVDLVNGEFVELARPRNKHTLGEIHPISYYVTSEGLVKAYKYAQGPGVQISDNFFKDFSQLLVDSGEFLRISIKKPTSLTDTDITEVEIPQYNATVLFPIKYQYILGDGIHHGETAKGEKHAKRNTGTHMVFNQRKENFITEAVFPILEKSV